MPRRRLSLGLAVAAATLVLGATSAAAYICHPDAPGTRTLVLRGKVMSYSMQREGIRVAYRDQHGCARFAVWKPLRGPHQRSLGGRNLTCAPSARADARLGQSVAVPKRAGSLLQAADGNRSVILRNGTSVDVYRGSKLVRRFTRATSGLALKVTTSGDQVVVLTRPEARRDEPFRLEVYRIQTGELLHRWPLVGRPSTLSLHGDLAAFAAGGGGGLYTVRLSDGRTTFFSPLQPGDTPQIGPSGLVYQSNLYERFNRRGVHFMKFLPMGLVQESVARVFHAYDTRWRIVSFSMDGPRVAVALDAPAGVCDEVRYWNIPWHYVSRIAMREDITCAGGFGMNVRAVALGGIYAEWIGSKSGATKLITSDSKTCVERVALEADSLRGVRLAGDGHLLGFALPKQAGRTGDAIGLLHSSGRKALFSSPSPVEALSVDSGRVAALTADGRVLVLSSNGELIQTLAPSAARAIALRREQLIALGAGGTLEVWNVLTGEREQTWPVPRGASSVDVHFGIAVFTAARTVYAMTIADGRTVALARAPRRVRAQIEAPGVAYQYDRRQGSSMRFIPLTRVEARLAAG